MELGLEDPHFEEREQFFMNVDSFYIYMRGFRVKWDKLMDEARVPLQSLCDITEQFQMVEKVLKSKPEVSRQMAIMNLPDLIQNLLPKILASIDSATDAIARIERDCSKAVAELEIKLSTVVLGYSAPWRTPEFDRQTLSPSTTDLCEWATHLALHYHRRYMAIHNAYSKLAAKKIHVLELVCVFKWGKRSTPQIDRIFAYTQYVGTNED